MKFLLTFCLGICCLCCFAQKVEGHILSKLEGEELYGISVIALAQNSFVKGTSSDENGNFSLDLEVGSYQLVFKGLAYSTDTLNLIIDGQNVVLGSIFLEEFTMESEQAIISSRALKVPSVTTITKDFFDRIPGAFSDPSRLTIKFPGISPTNDQSNEIIVRGLAPHLSRWAINGASIVNPNHLSNAGTITDLASASGGGVNMISGNSIGSYSFYANPISESFYNVTGGISNTNLKIPEGLNASIGLLGTEVSYQNNGKINVGINYRYSTLGILSAIGIPLGDEKINFQDIHIHFGKNFNKHVFKYDFIYGVNSNLHESLAENSIFFKDALYIKFSGNQLLSSFQHQFNTNKKQIKNVLNISNRYAKRVVNSDGNIIPEFMISEDFDFGESLISLVHSSQFTIMKKLKLKWNGQAEFNEFSSGDNGSYDNHRYYFSTGIKWNNDFFTIDVDPGVSVLDNKLNIEFRGSMVSTLKHGKVKFAYGHMANAIIAELNYANLTPFLSNNFSLDYYLNSYKMYFQVGLFYNNYSKLPVSLDNFISYFDRIDLIKEELINNSILNVGRAQQYGIQAQFEYLLFNKIQFISTASFYDLSVNRGSVIINSSYNFNYTYANTISYTKSLKKGQFISSLAFQGRGAGYESVIDEAGSLNNINTTHRRYLNKERTLNPYFRIDFKFDYLWGKENRNRIGVDVQNVSNRRNDAYFFYDPLLRQIQKQNQLGIIPIIKYTRNFL